MFRWNELMSDLVVELHKVKTFEEGRRFHDTIERVFFLSYEKLEYLAKIRAAKEGKEWYDGLDVK